MESSLTFIGPKDDLLSLFKLVLARNRQPGKDAKNGEHQSGFHVVQNISC